MLEDGLLTGQVPTSICYAPDGRISWGFQTQHETDPDADIRDWFKVFFDASEYNRAKAKDPDSVPPSHADVKLNYEDFLRKLYPHIKKTLRDNVPDWETANIEFLFSVPTTWTKLGLTLDFKSLVKAAGFGREGKNHSVDVSLTEAEAAAVHTFTAQNAVYTVGRSIPDDPQLTVVPGWRCDLSGRRRWRYDRFSFDEGF